MRRKSEIIRAVFAQIDCSEVRCGRGDLVGLKLDHVLSIKAVIVQPAIVFGNNGSGPCVRKLVAPGGLRGSELKRDLVSELETYRTGWVEIEEMGAVLKDPRTGLLDFYGEVDGKLVWLCWKYGETECGFYHALAEGFSARKSIGASVRSRLLN